MQELLILCQDTKLCYLTSTRPSFLHSKLMTKWSASLHGLSVAPAHFSMHTPSVSTCFPFPALGRILSHDPIFYLEHLLSNLEFWMLLCEVIYCHFYSSCLRDCSFWITHNTVTGVLSPTPRAHLGSHRTVFPLLSVLWVHIYDLNSNSPCIALKVIFKMWKACLP